jgi:hypothetical protein
MRQADLPVCEGVTVLWGLTDKMAGVLVDVCSNLVGRHPDRVADDKPTYRY